MKICIDISQIIYETGVSWYTRNLVETLLKIDKQNEYILYGGSARRINELWEYMNSINATGKIYPIPPTLADILFNTIHYPKIEFLVGKIDVFHSSDWSQPPTQALSVTTVHDLWPLLEPNKAPQKIVNTHMRRIKRIRSSVDQVIVPSMATKKDLVDFGVKEQKIHVIYEAVGDNLEIKERVYVNKVKKKYKVNGGYLLSVGVGVRKNTDRIIEAYQKIKKDDLKLVIVGNAPEEHSEHRGVRFTGHISSDELSALYCGAQCLLYPSLYEGFGLPILEAFNLRCPVVTSDLSSMKEIAADAAVLINPYEVDMIIQGIEKVLVNRDEFIKKGIERAKDFSWKETAQKTLEVYKIKQ